MSGSVACVLFLLHLQRCLCAINEDTLTCRDNAKISGNRSMLKMFCDTRGYSEYSFYEIIPGLDLSSVRVLDISDTVLKDNFSFVEKLMSLEKLKMRVCGSTIALLNALSQIQGLRVLDLAGSNLSGSLNLGSIAKLPSLEELNLSNCNLTSASLNTLSKIETHKNLRVLYLDDNDLSDLLDLGFIAKLPSLEKLDLCGCRLTSACLNALSEIETHKSLRVLYLDGNDFTDLLDLGSIAKLPSLEKLVLSNCNLMSASLKTLSRIETHENLKVLYLAGNDFTDLLDLGFVARVPSLEKLYLGNCSLTSASLKTLSRIEIRENLRVLDLSYNDFSDLPDFTFIAKLPSLKKLDLSCCSLTSASLNTLSRIETRENLRELSLYDNDFIDLLDLGFIAKLPSLVKLRLSDCNLTSASLNTLSGIETHKSLRVLNLCDSNFSGSLDLAFVEKLPSLEKLDLGGCGLTPACLNTLSEIETHESLRVLDLYGNDFSDSLDLAFVAKLPSLRELNLSDCRLTSASLNTLSRIESLRELNLSGNYFSGLLDLGFIAKLPSLEKLDLSSCKLTSASLKTLSGTETHENLKELDLSHNGLSDLLDLRFVVKLPSLEKLYLGNCSLTSACLNTLSEIETHENVRVLDLSFNDFSNLPDFTFIAKLPSLKELDLSCCSLTPGSKSRISELMRKRECNLKLWP